jgi:hypothetical protein
LPKGGHTVHKKDCIEVLRQHMPPEALDSLLSLATPDKGLPIEYDRDYMRFEPGLDTLDPETTDPEVFDSVLTACDILTQYAADLDLSSIAHTGKADAGQADLVFSFDSDDPQLEAFYALLRPFISDKDFVIDLHRNAGTVELVITVRFSGEHDYQQKKDQVYLLRDIATRRVKEQPYQGTRL